MTTPQQRPQTAESTERTSPSAGNVNTSRASGPDTDTPDAAERTGPSAKTTQATESSTMGRESSAPRTDASDGESLFAGRELSSLRSRWADVQAGFVDDPRECVQKADNLVADLVDQLTAGFAEARSRLEEQWARGEQVSTEDLRVALKRYRDFFEGLLAV